MPDRHPASLTPEDLADGTLDAVQRGEVEPEVSPVGRAFAAWLAKEAMMPAYLDAMTELRKATNVLNREQRDEFAALIEVEITNTTPTDQAG